MKTKNNTSNVEANNTNNTNSSINTKKENVMFEIIFVADKKLVASIENAMVAPVSTKPERKARTPKVEGVVKTRLPKVRFESELGAKFKADRELRKSIVPATPAAQVAPKARTTKANNVVELAQHRSMKVLAPVATKMQLVTDEKAVKRFVNRYIKTVGAEVAASHIRFILRHLKDETLNNLFAPYKKVANQ